MIIAHWQWGSVFRFYFSKSNSMLPLGRRNAAGKKMRPKLELARKDVRMLKKLSVSLTDPHDQVVRAKILLAYHAGESKVAISRRIGVCRPTVDWCINKALAAGVQVSIQDLSRPGRPNRISPEDKAWVLSIACSDPSEFGLTAKRWTHSMVADYVRRHATSSGHAALHNAGKVTVQRILKEHERELQQDARAVGRGNRLFEQRIAQVLFIPKEIELLRMVLENRNKQDSSNGDENSAARVTENMTADLVSLRRRLAPLERNSVYELYGSLTLLAGLDLRDGHVHAVVHDGPKNSEFIKFLKEVDEQYPEDWKIKLLLDNDPMHVSKQVIHWMAGRPGRFEFVFSPNHTSWLNIVEIFFCKLTGSFLRSLKVQSKDEIIEKLYNYIYDINESPALFRWDPSLEEVLS